MARSRMERVSRLLHSVLRRRYRHSLLSRLSLLRWSMRVEWPLWMRVSWIPKLKRVSKKLTSGSSGTSIDHLKVHVKSSSLNSTMQRVKKLSGTHLLMFLEKHLRTNLECNSLLDHQLIAGFSMTLILDLTCSERIIIRRLKQVSRRLWSKNRSLRDLYCQRTKPWNFLVTTLSRSLSSPTKSQMVAESLLTDAELSSIFALDLTSLTLTSSRLGKSWRTPAQTGWERLTMIPFRESMVSPTPIKNSWKSTFIESRKPPRETIEE